MTIRFQKIFQLWAPPLAWALLIFYFSSWPTGVASTVDWQDFVVKKLAHVMEYGIFTVLFYRALKESGLSKIKAACFYQS